MQHQWSGSRQELQVAALPVADLIIVLLVCLIFGSPPIR